MSVKIYWASRLVSGIRNVNHHFALIVWDSECPFVPLPLKTRNEWFYITLGGHPSKPSILNPENLVFKANEDGDEASGRRIVTVLQSGSRQELGYSQYREVSPPTGNAALFAQTLIRMAMHYGQYSAGNPISYQITGPNSNSWCNALFQAAGVSDQNRRQLRDFSGLDVASDVPISMSYFSG